MIFIYIISFCSTNTTQMKSSTTLTNSPVPGSSVSHHYGIKSYGGKTYKQYPYPCLHNHHCLIPKQSHKLFSTRSLTNKTTSNTSVNNFVLCCCCVWFFLQYLYYLLHPIHNRVISMFEKWYQINVIVLWSIESPRGFVKTQTALLLPPSVGLGWDPRIHISNKFNDADDASPGTTP